MLPILEYGFVTSTASVYANRGMKHPHSCCKFLKCNIYAKDFDKRFRPKPSIVPVIFTRSEFVRTEPVWASFHYVIN